MEVKVKDTRELHKLTGLLKGQPRSNRTATLTFERGSRKWFMVVDVELSTTVRPQDAPLKAVAFDPGVRTFLTGIDTKFRSGSAVDASCQPSAQTIVESSQTSRSLGLLTPNHTTLNHLSKFSHRRLALKLLSNIGA